MNHHECNKFYPKNTFTQRKDPLGQFPYLTGYLDMTLKFKTQEGAAALGNVSDGEMRTLILTGNLMEFVCGEPIDCQDCVRIIHKY